MKLKTVTISYEYVIVVEDDYKEVNVLSTALEHAADAFNDISKYDLEISIDDYTPGYISGWSNDCIPYGGNGNTNTGEYLK